MGTFALVNAQRLLGALLGSFSGGAGGGHWHGRRVWHGGRNPEGEQVCGGHRAHQSEGTVGGSEKMGCFCVRGVAGSMSSCDTGMCVPLLPREGS